VKIEGTGGCTRADKVGPRRNPWPDFFEGDRPFHNFIEASHGTLGVRKKVITPWCNLKSAFQHKTKPSGLRKRCYAEEILWNIKE
jgi:hypothetical protein